MSEESIRKDESFQSSGDAEPTPGGEESSQEAPPLNIFVILYNSVNLFASFAWQFMGLVPNPQTGKIEQDLEQARVAVDSAAALAQQLEGHLQDEDVREVRRVIQDLKINYVRKLDQSKEGSSSR